MGKYIVKRLFQALVVVLLISVIAFMLVHIIPGDPVFAIFGENISQEQYEMYYQDLGLDRPLLTQYIDFITGFVKGDMGWSYRNSAPVSSLIAGRIGKTIFLGVCAGILGVVIGVLLGIVCAVKKDSFWDQTLTTLANVLVGAPAFWIAVVLVYFFSAKWNLFDSFGFCYPWENFGEAVRKDTLPIIVMSLGGVATYMRQTRSSMLEVIKQDYMRTARSKGLSERKVIYGHALKNALVPILTLVASTLRTVIAGSVIVESIFNIQGIGLLLTSAIKTLDFQVVQSVMMFVCILACLINLVVDIAYAFVDPRIRLSQ